MTITGGIKYSDPIDFGLTAPYDGIDIKSDRQGGWVVRHRLLGKEWILAVPERGLADRIHDALTKVAERATTEAKEAKKK